VKKILIASDHAGFDLKSQLVSYLKSKNFEVTDFVTQSPDSVDYPDYANLVCQAMNSDSLGVLVCGSGQGMCIRANKFAHIRAALVYNDDIAKLSREHNDANVICLGSRFVTLDQAKKFVDTFLSTDFAQGRHQQRVAKLSSPTS